MNTSFPHSLTTRRTAQAGFTLVELMIAVLIGLFLVGGLLTLTSAMKRTGAVEGGLSQLHDNERVALSLMTETIQSSGYFQIPSPPPANATAVLMFPATGTGATAFVAGQTIVGTDGGSGSAQTDTVIVRYASAGTSPGGDGTINCIGGTSVAAANWIAKFQVDGNGNLQCVLTTNTVAANPVTVATGVQYMSILYGVQTNSAAGTYSVDTYLTATQVTSSNFWPNVISVMVTLSFVNPMYCAPPGTPCQAGQQPAPLQPQYISVSRAIALMNKTGVNT
jgi:type IV pilus assembly protein PilW